MQNRSDRKRKIIAPKEPRKVIKVYVTTDEHSSIKASAATLGMSLTDYCYDKILKGKVEIIEKYSSETIKAVNNLSGAFNNLNQIARHLNQGNSLDAAVAMELSNLKNLISKTLGND
jgi:hypothetical protein